MIQKQETVNSVQMATLFFTFLTGSSIINIQNPMIIAARNGAWLSLLISGAGGLLVLGAVLYLNRRFPELTFIEYSRTLIGKWATAILALLPIPFMVHMSTGTVLNVGLFMTSSMMREAPLYIFSSFIFLVAALTARAGLEVMARMFTLLIMVTMVFNFTILLLAIPDYDPSNLLPVMPYGFKPVLNGAYSSFGFPYEEVFLFVMLLPFVRKDDQQKLPRTMISALLLNITVLVASTICTIMNFGPLAGERKYSLFEIARTIEVQEIIQRIESVIGMSLIVGSYMKATLTLYILNLYLTQLLKLKDNRLLIFPLALLSIFRTLSSFAGVSRWAEIVTIIHPLWASFSYLLPLAVLFAAALFRKKPGPAP